MSKSNDRDFSGVTHYTQVDVQPGGINIENVERFYQADMLKALGIELEVKKKVSNSDEGVFTPCKLEFFDPILFGTENGQKKLAALLKEAAVLIDVNQGNGWFCVYAAYRYYKMQLGTKKEYVNFFTDIENLLPGILKKINANESGDKRYHTYTQTLSSEAEKWYVDDGKLPELNKIAVFKNKISRSKDDFDIATQTIRDVFKMFRELYKELKEE